MDQKRAANEMKEILLMSYWEQVKAEKDLARIFPPDHKQRIELNKSANEILDKINKLKNQDT